MYKRGKVKFYSPHPDKQFGFVIVDGTGEEVFFHQTSLCGVGCGLVGIFATNAVKPSRQVKTGDRVLIGIIRGRRGRIRAQEVMLEEDSVKALDIVTLRRFRVVSRDYMVLRGERVEGKTQVVWEGNVFDLCEEYPVLPDTVRRPDGYRLEYFIEMQEAPDGQWVVPPNDPREQLKREAFTVTARAILAKQGSTP